MMILLLIHLHLPITHAFVKHLIWLIYRIFLFITEQRLCFLIEDQANARCEIVID